MKPLWQHTFDDEEPDDFAPEEYVKWVQQGSLGAEAVEHIFLPYLTFVGSWQGWAFKLGSQGLGYYKEGANHHVVSPATVIPKPVPVTLNLDGLIQHQEQPKQQGVTEILGDPLKATMAEEADKELKATARKPKKQKARSAVGGEFVTMCNGQAGCYQRHQP